MGMKCVQCNTDNNLRHGTRRSGRCKKCNHPFVFDPSSVTDKKLAFTDKFFKKALEDISSQNMLFFTPKQFLYLIDKRLKAYGSVNGFIMLYRYVVTGWCVAVFGIFFILILFSSVLYLIDWQIAFLIIFIVYNIFSMGYFLKIVNLPINVLWVD